MSADDPDADRAFSASPRDAATPAELAERVRAALIERALTAHEDARLQGLCMEGAWEAAVSALRALDVAALVRSQRGSGGPDATTGRSA